MVLLAENFIIVLELAGFLGGRRALEVRSDQFHTLRKVPSSIYATSNRHARVIVQPIGGLGGHQRPHNRNQ